MQRGELNINLLSVITKFTINLVDNSELVQNDFLKTLY